VKHSRHGLGADGDCGSWSEYTENSGKLFRA
jgi:hypothetical protein